MTCPLAQTSSTESKGSPFPLDRYLSWMACLPALHGLPPPCRLPPASSHCVSVKSLGYMFSSDSPQTPTHIPCRVPFY